MLLKGNEAKLHINVSLSGAFPPVEGEQIKLRHAICDNGVDHKERFYLANKGGIYLFHCHNCGVSGVWHDKDYVNPLVHGFNNERDKEHKPKAPTNTTYCYDDMSVEAKAWLAQYEFEEDEWAECGMCFDKGNNGVVMPIWLDDGHRAGIQTRNMNPGDTKYTTLLFEEAAKVSFWKNPSIYDSKEGVYIVEDLLSSYKLNMSGLPAIALLGTSVDVEALAPIIKDKQVHLWMDSDLAGNKAVINLKKDLDPLCKVVRVFYTNKQPKEESFNTLREVIGRSAA